MTIPAPTVFLVDDDAAVLKAVSRLLRSSGLGVTSFPSAQAFLDQHDREAHGCAVLDVQMPGLTGLELQNALAADGGSMPIIFLSGQGDIPMTAKAMKRGAVDFLTKPVDEEELLAAVHSAIKKDRNSWLTRVEVAELNRRMATLTPREVEVMTHVISGKLNKQTAAELGTALQTIKVHRGRVMEKLNVESVAELVRIAERVGIKTQE